MTGTLTIDEILAKLEGVKPSGDDWTARCPVAEHDDHRQSLTVAVGEKAFLFTCHKGCATEHIASALGYTMADLFLDRGNNGNGKRTIDATYDYVDEAGQLLSQKVRYAPKDFRQRRPDGSGGWAWKLGDVRRVLYRLPEVVAGVAAGKTVYVVEGEKDADAIAALGLVATCNPEGASESGKRSKWRPEYSEFLRGAHVVIVADKDEAGRAHARTVAASLAGVAASVRIVEAAEGKDASDHLDAGFTPSEFVDVDVVDAGVSPAEADAEIRVRTPAEVCAVAGDRPDWIIFGLVARNAITEIIAKMKTGKTDVILAGVDAILTGDNFLGHATQRVEVLYLTEERPPSFADALRRRGMDQRSGLHIILRSGTLNMTWPEIVEFVRAYVRANGIGLVVIDTLSDWASLAADEENDSSAALEAVRPLQLLAADNVAVWTGRHSRKGYAGDVADSGRGSGAFTGAVEIVLGLQKMVGSGNKNQRKVIPVGRFNDTPAESFVIERQGYSYTVIGTPGQVGREGARQSLLESTPGNRENAVSASALFKAAGVTSTIGYELLKELKAKGIVVAEKGAGTSGKGEGFWRSEGEL